MGMNQILKALTWKKVSLEIGWILEWRFMLLDEELSLCFFDFNDFLFRLIPEGEGGIGFQSLSELEVFME